MNISSNNMERENLAVQKKVISTEKAPKAIGPYSQAIVANGFVFVSGNVAADAQMGEIIGLDTATQTKKVLENLKAVLDASGSSMDKVVKTTVYLKNMDDFQAMNKVYAEFFTQHPPARATVEVARLPRNVLVEIDAIALV